MRTSNAISSLCLKARWLTALFLLATVATVQAGDYTYTTNNGTITITRYTGISTTATIPGTIENLPVASIGENAFYNCTSLTNIVVGTNVTSIGIQAFRSCSYLKNVAIPNSTTNIGRNAFQECSRQTAITVDVLNSFYSSLNGVLFNKNQTTLITYPGGNNGSYTIPGGVTKIENYAFWNCTRLTDITFPDSVTSIGESAFDNCTSLTNVMFGNGVRIIADDAFWGCFSLTSIVIPNSVTYIGWSAFSNCYNLTNVTIGSGVTSIGYGAFGCYNLSVIIVDTNNTRYTSVDGVLFDKGQTTLIKCPPNKAGNYTITNSVTRIEGWAFSGCRLTSITIPDSVIGIEGYTFSGCTSLDNVMIGNSVTYIGSQAFNYCTNLTSVTIPASVTTIESGVFDYCSSLTGIYFRGNAPGGGYEVFPGIFAEVFYGADNATVYYLPGATGWPTPPAEWGGCPTALWDGAPVSAVQVTITPAAAASAGARWQVDSSAWQNSGGTVSGLSVGNHTLHFNTINGWDTPSDQSVTVDSGSTTISSGIYAQQTGSLQVTISPETAISVGAQWRVDGGAWQNSGATVSALPVGSHTLEFSTMTGWITPANRDVTINKDVTSTASGNYIQQEVTIQREFAFTTNNWKITITGYIGPGGAVTIPDTINSLPVTSIGQNAFQNCPSLTSVIIPNGVTNIGDGAFSDCWNLTSVIIPNSVTRIGVSAFDFCGGLTNLVIPSSVTSIGDDAFTRSGLRSITVDTNNPVFSSLDGDLFNKNQTVLIRHPNRNAGNYTIPSSVTNIGYGAFSHCTSLTSITIPGSVTRIEVSAFYMCNYLTSITILGNVTEIGSMAFGQCGSLVSIIIPDSVTTIGSYAFWDCISLPDIVIPSNVTSIGDGAFWYCSSLTEVYFKGNAPVGSGAFYDTATATVYHVAGAAGWPTVPDLWAGRPTALWDGSPVTGSLQVTITPADAANDGAQWRVDGRAWQASQATVSALRVGSHTLEFRTVLGWIAPTNQNVTISRAITSTASGIYIIKPEFTCTTNSDSTITITGYNRSGGNVVIPHTIDGLPVTSIGSNTFNFCASLTGIVIPNNVTNIGASAFAYCSNMTNAVIGSGVTSIGDRAFYQCTSLTSITIPISVTSIGSDAFYGDVAISSVIILSSVTSIGDRAFQDCTSLTNIVIPDGVASVGDWAFSGCRSLTSVNIPASVTWTYLYGTFANCTSLTSITIPDSVTIIEGWAFANCTSLTNVAIPGGVYYIGASAFAGCSSLTSVMIPIGVYYIASSGNPAFGGCTSLNAITVATNNSTYSSLDGVLFNKDQTTIIQYPGGKTGNYTIPASVTSIGESAFYYCPSLMGVSIPDSVTCIGWYAFLSCFNLTSVTIPSSVTSIGLYAFSGCTNLTSVYFRGNAPASYGSLFDGTPANLTVYYLSGATGWPTPPAEWNYRPTALWDIPRSIPTVMTSPTASAITVGQALNASTLSGGVASVPGVFAFTSPATVPSIGTASQSVTFTPTDLANYNTVVFTVSVTVLQPLQIITSSLPTGQVNQVYSFALAVTGGAPPYAWYISGGNYAEMSEPNSFASNSAVASGWHADDSYWPVALPFSFPLYGGSYTQCFADSNGRIRFDSGNSDYTPSLSDLQSGAIIAALWGDLSTYSLDDIYVSTNGGSVNIRWDCHYLSGSKCDFSITLSADGTIRLSYGPGNVSGGYIGISGGGGTSYLVSMKSQSGSMSNAQDIVFRRAGTLPSGMSVSTNGVLSGTPQGVSSNDLQFRVVDSIGYVTNRTIPFITVRSKVTPTVTNQPTASAITYGQALADSTLTGGAASVPGVFAFTLPATIPNAGTTNRSVTFTPTDTVNYDPVVFNVSVTVLKVTPTVTTWPAASPITYGQTLANSTLTGGVASVAGAFTYDVPTTAPTAGVYSAAVTFTPTDTTNYNTVVSSVNVTVNKAIPAITTSPTASAITYGQALSASTLTGGVASVSGAFAFTVPTTIPNAGAANQSVTFTPTDMANYETRLFNVSVTVHKITPAVTTAPTASAINCGQALSASILSGGAASVPGIFAFTTALTVPNAGTANQSVTFTPTDAVNYNTIVFNVSVTVRKASPTFYVWTNFVGQPDAPGNADDTNNAARFYSPFGVTVDNAGNLFVADTENHTIRKVTPSGVVTTLAGSAGNPGTANGTGSVARFYNPSGVAVDTNGNVFVADTYKHTIRKVTPAGVVTTLAGSAGNPGSANGTGSAARFRNPYSVAIDSAGNLFVADQNNQTIRKVTPAGAVTTLAGLAGNPGSADGTGSAARFSYPRGVAVDSEGNVFVADTENHMIRKVTSAGVVTTLAGSAENPGSSADGTGSAAGFNYPSGVAADSAGNVYVADTENHTIRKVTAEGVVTTIGGVAGVIGWADGLGSSAKFSSPYGIAVDSADGLYVADSGNHRITRSMPSRLPRFSGSLAFGDVATNASTTRTVEVWNDGSLPLLVTSVSTPTGFTASPQTFTVPSGEAVLLNVQFAPAEEREYSGVLSLVCDATAGFVNINVSGTGIVPPAPVGIRSITGLTAVIAVDVPDGATVLGVEDELAPGMTPGLISDGGTWDAANRKVKWFFAESEQVRDRALQYTVDCAGSVVTGTVSFGSGNLPITGDTVFTGGANPGLLHPADANGDWRVVLDEAASCVSRWKAGVGDEKTSFVVRGITLYLQGELYYYDLAQPIEAKRWMPLGIQPMSLKTASIRLAGALYLEASGEPAAGAVRNVQGTNVTITVVPPSGTTAWGLEESVPAGVVVASVSHEGSRDIAHGSIKWAFFDGTARTLSYSLSGEAETSVTLSGNSSFDGSEDIVTGAACVVFPLSFSTWAERNGVPGANPGAICSNGINTFFEAYIAGLNPTNSQSALRVSGPSNGKVLGWNAVSGRVYNVYWTTNLMSGFQCLESNIPWTRSSFTNSTVVPRGFYKIDVRLEN